MSVYSKSRAAFLKYFYSTFTINQTPNLHKGVLQLKVNIIINKEKNMTQVSISCLFSSFISLNPAIPLFPQPNRWLHKRVPRFPPAHVSTLNSTVTLLSPYEGVRTQSRDVLMAWLCVCADKATETQTYENCILLYAVQIILLTYKVYIILMGSSQGLHYTLLVQALPTDSGQLQK